MRSILYLSLSALSLAHCAWAKLYTDPSQLPKTQYDFVVVGAGTAGNVVARRLADKSFSVLVIEAGINNDNTLLQIPYLAPTLLSNTSLYWNYNTVPQTGLNSRTLAYARGRVLGGSSSVNIMFYTRGSKDDFNRIASVTGDSGWSWNSILPFIKNGEKFTQPTDGHNTAGQFDPSVHGFNGLLKTDLGNFPSEIDSRIVASTKTNPSQFPFNLDANSGNTIGVGWAQYTSGGGERSSSATAYLQPVIGNANIDVLIQTQVTKLINVATSGTPDLRKVEFAQSSSGQRFTVTATKEVILSAGSINTPQILLLSGVGPQSALSSLGIHVLANSPGVGQNLQDHPLLCNTWTVNSTTTTDDIARNSTLANQLVQQWATSRTGQLTDVGINLIGWLRIPSSNRAVWQGASDPSAGPTSSHIELLPAGQFVSFLDPAPSSGSFLTIITNVVSPVSRGSVTLASSDPFTFPNINPAFLTNSLDSRVMLEAVKTAKALVATNPWKGYVVAPFGDLASATTDAQLLNYIRNKITTFWHPTSTAKMGKSSDPSAVVDPQLLVKGVKGVRVVDASVFPYIPAAHPQGAVYGVAERAANLIATKWK